MTEEEFNVEVLWSEEGDEGAQPIGMIVNKEELTMDEYHEKYPLEAKGEMKEVTSEERDELIEKMKKKSKDN